jgi:hypothetical protein
MLLSIDDGLRKRRTALTISRPEPRVKLGARGRSEP